MLGREFPESMAGMDKKVLGAIVRWLGSGPLFPVTLHSAIRLEQAFLVAAPLGIVVGFASAGLSRLMYGFEDGFEHSSGRLRIHWMWWPAIGGIGIGAGGFFFPRGLGVGYDTSRRFFAGTLRWPFCWVSLLPNR